MKGFGHGARCSLCRRLVTRQAKLWHHWRSELDLTLVCHPAQPPRPGRALVAPALAALAALKSLKLADNKLGAGGAGAFGAGAEVLLGCAALQTLTLDRNGLGALPQLPPKLKMLSAAGNALAELPPPLLRCGATLRSLDLSANRLELLAPAVVAALLALEDLVLDDNALLMLPEELAARRQGAPRDLVPLGK